MQICFVILLIIASSLAGLPDFIKPCRRNAQDLNECVKENIQVCKERVSKGIPGLHIPPLDPFKITSTEIKNTFISIGMHNTKVQGLSGFNVPIVNFNFSKNEHLLKIDFPELIGTTSVNLQGSLIQLNLFSNGHVYGNTTDVEVLIKFKTEPYIKNGKEYLKIKDKMYQISLGGKLFVNFQNIYRDNQLLSDTINKLFNENKDVFLKDLGPMVEYMFDLVIGRILSKILTNIPYDELFPLNQL